MAPEGIAKKAEQSLGPDVSSDVPRVSWRNSDKRILDFFFTLLTAPLWLPIIVLLGVIIKLQDGGPIIYRRRVVGLTGDFDAFKLRTMRADADRWLEQNPQLLKEFEKNFKLRADPRITRFGRFLRKYSLDEIPQLVNVLRGEMSLVGPRMITRPELEKYGSYQNLLLTVRPGLTGHWQVSGRQDVSYDDRVTMDVFYIQNRSMWFDLTILVKTVGKVLKREGAY